MENTSGLSGSAGMAMQPTDEQLLILKLMPVMAKVMEFCQKPVGVELKPPRFDGSFSLYPVFRREWESFQDQMLRNWEEKDIVKELYGSALNKKAKELVQGIGSLAGMWRILDRKYLKPALAFQEILDRVLKMQNPRNSSAALCVYYEAIMTADMEARSSNIMSSGKGRP